MSADIHIEAMCWLRYGKKMPVVCTEAGTWNADVLGVSQHMAVEVEVKKSKADLMRDFTGKRAKHSLYANATDKSVSVPNYMYFFVPPELEEYALKTLEEKAPKIGLVVHHPDWNLLDGRNAKVVKKPKKLRDGKPTPRYIEKAIMRMSSQLCGREIQLDYQVRLLVEAVKVISEKTLTAVVRSSGALDIEGEVDDINRRAAELAWCVEGVEYATLDSPAQQKWIVAAHKLLEASYLTKEDTNAAIDLLGSNR